MNSKRRRSKHTVRAANMLAISAIVMNLGTGTVHAQDESGGLPTTAQLSDLIAAFDVPGLAMVPLENCAPGDAIVVGKADLSTGADVTPLTAFEAASLTKPVFAYLVMTLVADGVIDLDQPISASFDYARITDSASYAALTPRMILMHRTGLPNWVDEETAFHVRTAVVPFHTAPGQAFSYSGEGFQLLQAFVEHETGQSLQQLFQARLGAVMPNSTLALPLPDGVVPSRGYESRNSPESGRGMTNLYPAAMAASSLVTTADDYAAFLSKVCQAEGLPQDIYAEMIRPQSPTPPDFLGDGGEGPVVSWGLGWMTADFGDELMVGHGGNNNEYQAFAGFMKNSGDGIVVLTNGANGQALINSFLLP